MRTLALGSWKRKGAAGAFINMLGAGRSCDAYVCEIAAQTQTVPERYLFEELIYVLKGRGATTVWQENGRKQTFEWQEGSMFTPPLNTWRQHFNAQGDEFTGFVVLTDAPVMINRFRNLDFIFSNDFAFADRFSGEDGYVESHRTWDANFIADVPGFRLLDTTRAASCSISRLIPCPPTSRSTPSAPIRGPHWHGPGAHILILSGEGYSFLWEQGKDRERIDWKPGSLFVPPAKWFHQHFNVDALYRKVAKRWEERVTHSGVDLRNQRPRRHDDLERGRI